MRAALREAVRRLAAAGLNYGATGNVSVRTGQGLLVTPTSVPWDRLEETAMVELAGDGTPLAGQGVPSSEWRLHCDLYRARPDVHAVVHAHPPFATTIACLREDLPAVHYLIAVTGADRVRCSRYATFGTGELSRAAVEALGDSRACLLANHGLVTVGGTLAEALRVAEDVEAVAGYWWRARAVGRPEILSAAEMQEALVRIRDYGKAE